MSVLVCLAEHKCEVVSKEQLLATVWPDTFVTDDVLKRSISELRKALGDDTKEPRFIETIPKGGYRLLVSISPVAPKPDSDSNWGRTRLRWPFELTPTRIAVVISAALPTGCCSSGVDAIAAPVVQGLGLQPTHKRWFGERPAHSHRRLAHLF